MGSYLDDDYMESRPRRRSSTRHEEYGRERSSRERSGKRRSRSRNRDYAGDVLSPELFKYISLAIIIIAAAISGAVFLKVSFPIVAIVLVIVVIMGILLHNTPVYISVLLAAAILIVGMITKNSDIVLSAVATYLATILVFKED